MGREVALVPASLLLCLTLAQAAEPPAAPDTAGQVLLDVGLHAGVMLSTGTVATLGAWRGGTEPGLAMSELALGQLVGLPLAGFLAPINPLTVALDDYGPDAWTKAFVIPIGVGLYAGGSALMALGAWATERLPFETSRGRYLPSFAGAAIGLAAGMLLEAVLTRILGPPEVELPFLNWRASLLGSLGATGAMVGLRASAGP